jgi:hypothetical protein
LLLNRKYYLFVFVYLLTFIAGCGRDKEQKVNFDDEISIRNLASTLIEGNIKFVASGYFSSETGKSVVAGSESLERDKPGISFSLIEKVEDEFEVVYNTGILEGSFEKCVVDKIKFSSEPGELIYYNSKDFYIGSGGGDVFLYLVNMVKKEIYYAHLIVNRASGASLFLSDSTGDPMIRKFFVSYFRKDYGSLRIIENDIL